MNTYEERQQLFDLKLQLLKKAVAGTVEGSVFSSGVWLKPAEYRKIVSSKATRSRSRV